MKKIGLIVNPKAGQGAEKNLELARKAIAGLKPVQVFTGPGVIGGDAIPDASLINIPEGETGRKVTQWLAVQLAQQEIDAIVVIGGDGTMTDVAFALLEAGDQQPILGIGAGSTNIGGLVTCQAAEVEELASTELSVKNIDALAASCNGENLALAFNDMVIGTTMVGTLDGVVCDLDASQHLQGVRVPGRPQAIGTITALVSKKSPDGSVEVASGSQVGTVITGFAHADRFYGKAIAGGVCLTALVGLPAGCLVCEQPLVRVQLEISDLVTVEPVRSAYTSLAEADTIHITGIGPPAVLIADGNPLKALTPDNQVFIQVLRNAVRMLRVVKQ